MRPQPLGVEPRGSTRKPSQTELSWLTNSFFLAFLLLFHLSCPAAQWGSALGKDAAGITNHLVKPDLQLYSVEFFFFVPVVLETPAPLDRSQVVLGPCGHHGYQFQGQAEKGWDPEWLRSPGAWGCLQPSSAVAHRLLRPPALWSRSRDRIPRQLRPQ